MTPTSSANLTNSKGEAAPVFAQAQQRLVVVHGTIVQIADGLKQRIERAAGDHFAVRPHAANRFAAHPSVPLQEVGDRKVALALGKGIDRVKQCFGAIGFTEVACRQGHRRRAHGQRLASRVGIARAVAMVFFRCGISTSESCTMP